MPKFRTALFAALVLLGGCDAAPPEYKATHFVFGTLVEFTVYGSDAETARATIAEIGRDFRDFHHHWHAWQPGKLTRLANQLVDGQPHVLDPSLVPIFEQSIDLERRSEGLFNPAIGKLIALWGFHNDDPPAGPPPDAAQIARLVELAPSMADLAMGLSAAGSVTLRSSNRATQFDFGGFAKGYAIERAQQKLQAAGIVNSIINAGGDLCVTGQHGERPWRVAIRHPVDWGVLADIARTDGECAMTSGNYERFREHNDRRYAHIIDPRSGWPVDHIASVTVIADDGGVADAAATALTVAGTQQWRSIATGMGLDQALLVDDQGNIQVSRALYPRLIWPGPVPDNLVIVDL
ncbi:MAG: FAD:protein FMN transferase [Gammaproteobacteria bacterium]